MVENQYEEDGDSEVERYELREPSRFAFEPDRRGFAQSIGAGLMFVVSASAPQAARAQRGRTARRDELLSERFHLSDAGIVTVLTSKVEVGQGSRTQITQAAAEELRLPVQRVRLIMADTQLCPDDGGTAGSRTTPSTVPRVRNAAAALRDLLVHRAAQLLGARQADIAFDQGIFRSQDKQLSLAELATDKDFISQLQQAPPTDGLTVTEVDQWQILGTSVPKVTGRDVVTGAAQFPSDILRPEMQYGKIVRPVSYGAVLKAIDLSVAESMKGVTVVRDGDFIGCVAPTSFQAARARDAIAKTADWKRPDHPASGILFEHLKQTAEKRGGAARDSAQAEKAQKKIETNYTIAYIQHAPMEPRAAVAEWNDGKLTVWTGSQQPARVHSELCSAFRLAPERVRVIIPDTGGGFGGKHTGEAAVEAARLAKSTGKPVSLRWTREEEFTWAYFRPAGLIEVEAGVDTAGRLTHWNFTNYNSGGSAIETPYRVPDPLARYVATDSPLRQGSYRALASTANTFARESAMDELAVLAGIDPLEFRLRHLEDGRLKDVLLAAAQAFDWQAKSAKRVAQRGIGLSCGTEKGSFVAACAEIEVIDDAIRVLHVCQAYECGAIHNPDNLRAQVEGALVQGLGGALSEAMQFENGQILNDNFSSYSVPRMRDLPKMEIVLLNRDLPSVGGSETPIIAIAPAVANALYRATGFRSRSMPLRVS